MLIVFKIWTDMELDFPLHGRGGGGGGALGVLDSSLIQDFVKVISQYLCCFLSFFP